MVEQSFGVMEIEKPSKPVLTLLENNNVEVQWMSSKFSGTYIKKFEIAYEESTNCQYRTVPVNNKSDENKTVIHRLKQNTKYKFKIRALNCDDDVISEWSEETEILIDRTEDKNQWSSGEEDYHDPMLECITSDDEKDVFEIEKFKVCEPACHEVLYDRQRRDHQDKNDESNDENDFSIVDTVPSVPICIEKNDSHSLTLVWQKPSAYKLQIDCYDIYCKEGTEKAYCVRTEHDDIIYTVKNLKQNCSYKFRVCAVTKTDYKDNVSELSVESEPTTTNVSIASHLTRDESTREVKKDDQTKMVLYQLKCFKKGEDDKQNKIRHVIVGHGRDLGDGVDKRYVLLYGKTGSGKTTMIDLIVNHVYDVGWEDNFRLTAIDMMPDEMNRDESMSQTQWITLYEIKRKENSMLPYDLVLIDTPGFETDNKDTREKTRKHFKLLLSNGRLPGLHAVCFVNQSHSGKLTSTETILCETLSELVGSGINMNIFIFATCADSTKPMIERLLQTITFQYHRCFKFNNSPFTTECQMSRSNDQKNDWEKGKLEIFDFFHILKDLHLSTLECFRKNSEICQEIRIKYYAKREEITNACYEMMNIMKRDVHYKRIKVRNDSGKNSTICNKCRRNCCCPCRASRLNKRLCWNIYFFSGRCVACPNTCTLNDHEYSEFKYIQAARMHWRQQNQIDKEKLSRKRMELRTVGNELLVLLRSARQLQNELHKRTTLGVPYTYDDMIDSFINEQATAKNLDWEVFVTIFEKCKSELRKPPEKRWRTLSDLLDQC